jgi:putative tryptophan/tyrosine transport system substrate-binding protein
MRSLPNAEPSNPDLIVAAGGPVAQACAAVTASIPIVATFADPVKSGLVASLARPGSNITGVSVDAGIEIVGKRLQFLKEAVPSASTAAYLDVSGSAPGAVGPVLAEASRRLGISVIVTPLRESIPAEYERVFAEIAQQRIDTILVSDQGSPWRSASLSPSSPRKIGYRQCAPPSITSKSAD